MPSLRFAIVLAMAAALGPFAIDTYLPAFPSITQAMHASIDEIGLSVSLYVLGLAMGQLIGGSLSDRYGRAKVMLAGLVLFSLASLLLAFSHTLAELLVLRFIQALGGGCCSVNIPAVVRDHTEGREAAKLFSLIGLIMIIAPAIAPSIGTLILAVSHWPGIFVFLVLYSLLVMLLLKRYVFSLPVPQRLTTAKKMPLLTSYHYVLKNGAAVCLILIQAFAFGVLLIFLTNASFIYQEWFTVPNFAFALLFTCNVAVMGLLGFTNRLLLARLEPVVLLVCGVTLQALAVAALILIAFFHLGLLFFVPALMIAIGAVGMIAPNNQACFMQFFPHNSGAAAALMGALQLTLSSCMSALSAFVANGSLLNVILTMGLCAVSCVLLVWRAFCLIRAKAVIEAEAVK